MSNIDIFPLNEYENDRKRNRRKRIETMSSEKERNKQKIQYGMVCERESE